MLEWFLCVVIPAQLLLISVLLFQIYQKPNPKFPDLPETRYVCQSIVVKADSDITTVQPVPLAATTCTHDWETISEKTLTVSHEQKCVLVLKCRHCGSIDKTVVTTGKLPDLKSVWKKEDCCHKWEDEKSVRLESAFEQLAKAADDKSFDLKKIDVQELSRDFFRKTYLKVRVCKVCGEVNTIRASNYDTVEEGVNG